MSDPQAPRPSVKDLAKMQAEAAQQLPAPALTQHLSVKDLAKMQSQGPIMGGAAQPSSSSGGTSVKDLAKIQSQGPIMGGGTSVRDLARVQSQGPVMGGPPPLTGAPSTTGTSVKDLAKMQIPMPMMGSPTLSGPGPQSRITPRTSVSGSFAPVNPMGGGVRPSSLSGNAPPQIIMGAPRPTVNVAGAAVGGPSVGPSPRIAALAGGMNFGGFGAPRPSVAGPPASVTTSTAESTPSVEEQQANLAQTTRRRPSVRRNSRLSRTHFDDLIDVDVSNYMVTLASETPKNSTTPTMESFKEEGEKSKTFFATPVDVPQTLEEGWEVVDTHEVNEAKEQEQKDLKEQQSYLASFVSTIFSYAFSTVDPSAPAVPIIPNKELQKDEIKAEELKNEETKVEETKVEEVKTEEVKAEEVKVEEVKTEEEVNTEVSTEETKAEEVKVEETKAEETKAEETKAEETKAEETKAEETKAEETKAEQVNAEEVQEGSDKTPTEPNVDEKKADEQLPTDEQPAEAVTE